MKNLADHRAPEKILNLRPECTIKHANELLHLAAKSGNHRLMQELLSKYGADANSVIDGKTPLFEVKLRNWSSEVADLLLAHGADPFFMCDGKAFYQRSDFFGDTEHFNSKWMITLHKAGFDIEALLSELNPKATVLAETSQVKCWIPVAKLNKKAFEVLSQDKVDLHAAIDAEGKTLLHYAAEQFHNQHDSLRGVKLHALRHEPLQILMENDKDFSFGMRINGCKGLFAYLKEYLAMHGDGILKKIGGKEFLKSYEFERDESIKTLTEKMANADISEKSFVAERSEAKEVADTEAKSDAEQEKSKGKKKNGVCTIA